jgi:methyl-accepting chemotaxis protein
MRRKRFVVHKIQLWMGALVFFYALSFFLLAYLAPYVPPALTLASPLSLEHRAVAARQFLVLSQTLWPALVAIFLGAGVLSLYLTHRLGGALYRLEESAKDITQGNLAMRIQLRKGDQLQDLRRFLNEAVESLDRALGEIRTRQAVVRTTLRQLAEEMGPHLPATSDSLTKLEAARKEADRIDDVLSRFRLTESR